MASVFTPADGRRLELPGRASRQIVSGECGALQVTFRVVEIAPTRPDDPQRGPHVHHGFEECIHVQSGRGVTETESGPREVSAGDTILVPAGELHVTRNTGEIPLVLLCFFPVAEIAAGTREFPSWAEAKAAS